MKTEKLSYSVCLLRCADNSLCADITDKTPTDCLAQHNAGNGKPYTKGRLPVSLACSIEVESDVYEARGIYWVVRKLTRSAREKLSSNNKKVLQKVLSLGSECGSILRQRSTANHYAEPDGS